MGVLELQHRDLVTVMYFDVETKWHSAGGGGEGDMGSGVARLSWGKYSVPAFFRQALSKALSVTVLMLVLLLVLVLLC